MSFTQSGDWQESRMPVLWHRLITQTDKVSRYYGIGLASVWEWINKNDYPRARAELDRVMADSMRDRWATNPKNKYMRAHLNEVIPELVMWGFMDTVQAERIIDIKTEV